PVWPRIGWLRPFAWLIMNLDRGEWVRTEAELLALAEEACPGDWSIQRYLLSYHATEGAILLLRKPAQPAPAARRQIEECVRGARPTRSPTGSTTLSASATKRFSATSPCESGSGSSSRS